MATQANEPGGSTKGYKPFFRPKFLLDPNRPRSNMKFDDQKVDTSRVRRLEFGANVRSGSWDDILKILRMGTTTASEDTEKLGPGMAPTVRRRPMGKATRPPKPSSLQKWSSRGTANE